ncbi:neutral/alkaline non-lysosomal ceramidase N-terminal domain-containing protein [Novosphingobium terrae]|uniref:neutral/alkaline non-lysosomal ceramidase N-terminal domain-containing protein n=1 Tax=Novosphingobium terrae TaxID=2726189 RepID=UPI00197EEA11|nr:neutral/alkaline non-lysosomal ceramidase N-terminal domain-containing protein [Novosphingobium terrae]
MVTWARRTGRRGIKPVTLLLGLGLCLAALPASAGALRAGAGKADITNDAADFPIKVDREKDFVGVHDRLSARALALDDGARKIVLISLEVTTVPGGQAFTKAVAQALNLPESDVLIFSTHTHSNPLVFYHSDPPIPAHARAIARTREGAIAAARAALAALQPAKLGFGQGKGYANINNGEYAGNHIWFDPEGPNDKVLSVLRIDSASGKPLAMMVNYPSHGEVMFRSVTKDGGYEVTGDLPGATASLLENSGVAPIVLWSAAAEADQVPLFKSLQPAMGPLPATDEGAGGWALLDLLARRLAFSVSAAAAPIQTSPQASIAVAQGSISCPGQRMRLDQASGQITTTPMPDVTIPTAYVRINDVVLAGVGGDVGTAIGGDIRAGLAKRQVMVVSQIAGAVGYILPDSAYARPGHGVFGSPLKQGCAAPALVEDFRKLDGGR